jgi:hypothetical protein
MNRSCLFSLSLVISLPVVVALPLLAAAQPRVSVAELEGKGGAAIRGAVVRAIQAEPSVTLLSKDVVNGTAKRLGVRMPDGRGKISTVLKITTWVEGSVRREQKLLVADLTVVDAASGKALGTMTYDGRSSSALVKIVRQEFWADMGELLATGKPPSIKSVRGNPALLAEADASPTDDTLEEFDGRGEDDGEVEDEHDAPALAERDDRDAADEPKADPSEDGPAGEPAQHVGAEPAGTPLVMSAGLAAFSRHLSFNDDLSDLAPYDLALAPAMVLHVNWYPGAHAQAAGIAANVGLDLHAQFAFGLDSQAEKNITLATSASSFGIGVRARLPLGDNELAAAIGYGTRSFSIDADGTTSARALRFPASTSYSYLRVGVEASFALSPRFALRGALAYLPTFSTGVETWFPRASAQGIEGEMKLSYALSHAFDLSAALGMQRFALSFHPTLQDANAGRLIAGGAIEQYLSMTLGASFRLDSGG